MCGMWRPDAGGPDGLRGPKALRRPSLSVVDPEDCASANDRTDGIPSGPVGARKVPGSTVRRAPLCQVNLRAQVDVLDRVQQGDPVGHWLLERLAPGDQARAAGALIDHRG